MTWPHDIPKPSQTVIDDMACAAIMAKNTTGMADARRFSVEVYPNLYRLVQAEFLRLQQDRRKL